MNKDSYTLYIFRHRRIPVQYLGIGLTTTEALKPLKQLIYFGPGHRSSRRKHKQAEFLTTLGLTVEGVSLEALGLKNAPEAIYNAEEWTIDPAYLLPHRPQAVRLLNMLNSLFTKTAGDELWVPEHYSKSNPFTICL